jgi:hypothetical protein
LKLVEKVGRGLDMVGFEDGLNRGFGFMRDFRDDFSRRYDVDCSAEGEKVSRQ